VNSAGVSKSCRTTTDSESKHIDRNYHGAICFGLVSRTFEQGTCHIQTKNDQSFQGLFSLADRFCYLFVGLFPMDMDSMQLDAHSLVYHWLPQRTSQCEFTQRQRRN
jgi:hypothetical protein